MGWEVEYEGETELNPSKATYLIEVVSGSDTRKDQNGQEGPRKDNAGCPMTMYNCKIVMDSNGKETFRGYSFNVMIKHDEKGARIVRLMTRALKPEITGGKIDVSPNVFDKRMGWCEAAFAPSKTGVGDGFFNCNHSTWARKDSIKIATEARSTASADAASVADDEDAPF